MLRCLQSQENLAGNCTDMSVLERQREMQRRLQVQQPQWQFPLSQQIHVYQSKSQWGDLDQMPLFQSSISGDAVMQQKASNWPINFDRCFDNGMQNFGVLFGGESLGFSSSPEVTNRSLEIDHNSFTSVSISSSPVIAQLATASTVAEAVAPLEENVNMSSAMKKRKAEFDVEEGYKDRRKEGDAGEVQSEATTKSNGETSGHNSKENSKAQTTKPDYIHVRARRGQATDSHSLAERARREKIRKKMKCLQDLVPGCNKVTGKAGMLDEIINYVQSLQRQVEFLSMKLAALNPRLDFNHDHFIAKEFPAYMADFPAAAAAVTPSEVSNSAYLQCHGAQKGASTCAVDVPITPTQAVLQRTATSLMPIPEVYFDSSGLPQIQPLSTRETDLRSLYNVNFH